MHSRFLIGFTGIALCSFSVAKADLNATAERSCKPVVPQIIADFTPGDGIEDGQSVWMGYDEQGSLPYSPETFSGHLRHSFCVVDRGRCWGGRARYELRFEEPRFQSIQIRGKRRGETQQTLIGGVRWTGPSYPDRVLISCNLNNPDPQTACALTGVEHSANPRTSGRNGEPSRSGRHDQCEPETDGTGASFALVSITKSG